MKRIRRPNGYAVLPKQGDFVGDGRPAHRAELVIKTAGHIASDYNPRRLTSN